MDSQVITSIRRTKNNYVTKEIREVYLRSDIVCGLDICKLCNSNNVMKFEDNEDTIYILDYDTVFNQLDVLVNCTLLTNVVIMQTITEDLKKHNVSNYNILANLVDGEIYRKIYVFPNEFSIYCNLEQQTNSTVLDYNKQKVIKAAQWYKQHFQDQNINLKFITNHKSKSDLNLNEETIYEFVQRNADQFPNLIDFMGYHEDQQDTQMQEEKPNIFPEHLEKIELQTQVNKAELFKGKMFIDKNNPNQGFINSQGIQINLLSTQDMNRSISGEIVAVRLNPESEWIKQDLQVYDEEVEDSYQNQTYEDNEILMMVNRIKQLNLKPTGKVVGVMKRLNRVFCGSISIENNQNIFIPVDQRFPKFQLNLRKPETLIDKRIAIKFDSWPSNEQYPLGHLKEILGNIGDSKTEGDVILLEHSIETRQFTKQVIDCLPSQGYNWTIPQSEIDKRLDLRYLDVCSVDPPGCKDIDDALHCRTLSNGNLEIGVHIADVSHFVRPRTAIDLEAQQRCTTVYLVNRRTDMLPKLLTESLCSLVEQVDRLAFSVLYEINPHTQEIINTTFHKTVINNKCNLNYETAQKIINGDLDNLSYKFENESLIKSVKWSLEQIYEISKVYRNKRIRAGALTLASTQVQFSFSQETHNPTDVSFYKTFNTNSMIEEFMLLANISSANKIYQHFPTISILRKHSTPKLKQIAQLQLILKEFNFDFNFETNKHLQISLDKTIKQDDPFFNKVVRIMTTRTMNEATYFCTSDFDYSEFFHYGLAAPIYTHFTSPIRRYADILVHRLLAASVDVDSIPNEMNNKIKMAKICDNINYKNRMARMASRASSDYHQYLLFKDKKVQEQGKICNISRNGYNVLVERYGLEGFIKFNEQDQQINEENYNKNFEKCVTNFYINNQNVKLFDDVIVEIKVNMKSFHKQVDFQLIKLV